VFRFETEDNNREAVGLQCPCGFTGWFRFHTGSRVFRFEALVCFMHEHTGKSEAVGLQCPCGFMAGSWAGTMYACIQLVCYFVSQEGTWDNGQNGQSLPPVRGE